MSAGHSRGQDRRSFLAAFGAALASGALTPLNTGCLPPRAVPANNRDSDPFGVEQGILHLQGAIRGCAPEKIDIIPDGAGLSVTVDLDDQRVIMTHLLGERTIKIKTFYSPGDKPVDPFTFNVREPVDPRDRNKSHHYAARLLLGEAITKRVEFHASNSPGHAELEKIFFAEKGVDTGRDIKIRRTLQSTSISVSLPGQEQPANSVETSQPSLIIFLKRTESPHSVVSDIYEGLVGSLLTSKNEAWCEVRAALALLGVEGDDIYSSNLTYKLSRGEAQRLFMLFIKKREEGPIHASLGQSAGS